MPDRSDRGACGAPTDPKETVHARVRRETEPWHRAVEDAFAGLDLARRCDLARFLQAQARAVLPLERALDSGGIIRLVPDWPTRRRSDALIADLRWLGTDVPSGAAAALAVDGRVFLREHVDPQPVEDGARCPLPGGEEPGVRGRQVRMAAAQPSDPHPLPLSADEREDRALSVTTAPGHQLGTLYVLEGSRLGGRLLARRVAESPDRQVAQATAFLRHPVRPGAWAELLAVLNGAAVDPDELTEGAIEAFRRFHAAAMEA